jgi:hypothetical protein
MLTSIIKGDGEGITKAIADSAKTAVGKETFDRLMLGKRATEEFYNPGQHPELKAAVDDYIRAGGRIPIPETLDPLIKGVAKTIMDAGREFGDLHPFKGIAQIGEAVAKPIMEYQVPRAKFGAFTYLRDQAIKEIDAKYDGQEMTPELAQAKDDATVQKLQDVTRHLDNTFGQMVYDNLLISRKLRDGLFLLINYPGWNIGSASWMAGMARGSAQLLTKTEMDTVSKASLEFGFGTMMNLMFYGTVMQYMLTGKAPDNALDPITKGVWTGGFAPNGNKEYIRFATYMRDLIGVGTDPWGTIKAKEMWGIRMFLDIAENKDYWGNEIKTPDAGPMQNLKEYAKYFGKEMLPFAQRNILQGRTDWGKYGGMIGFSLTPQRLLNTPLRDELARYRQTTAPGLVTQEKQETRNAKSEVMDYAYKGDTPGFIQALREAKVNKAITTKQMDEMRKDGLAAIRDPQNGPLRSRFEHVEIGAAIKAMGKANVSEKQALMPLLVRKWTNTSTENKIKYRQDFKNTMQYLQGLN